MQSSETDQISVPRQNDQHTESTQLPKVPEGATNHPASVQNAPPTTTQVTHGRTTSSQWFAPLTSRPFQPTSDQTAQHMKLLKEFLASKNVMNEVHKIHPAQLNEFLIEFIFTVRQADGSKYEPCTLRSMISSFDRHLKLHNYPITIHKGRAFTKTMLIFSSKGMNIMNRTRQPNRYTSPVLSDKDIEQLYKCGQLGNSNPTSIINTLWFNNTFYFGMSGGGVEHRQLMWGDIQLCMDEKVSCEYLEYEDYIAKPKKPRIYATGLASCPIETYRVYAAHRPDKFSDPHDPFYLAVVAVTPISWTNVQWFYSSPLGKCRIATLMKTMSEKAGLSTRLTNSCISKRRQHMSSNPDTCAGPLTEHKNTNTFNTHTLPARQQATISTIIADAFKISHPSSFLPDKEKVVAEILTSHNEVNAEGVIGQDLLVPSPILAAKVKISDLPLATRDTASTSLTKVTEEPMSIEDLSVTLTDIMPTSSTTSTSNSTPMDTTSTSSTKVTVQRASVETDLSSVSRSATKPSQTVKNVTSSSITEVKLKPDIIEIDLSSASIVAPKPSAISPSEAILSSSKTVKTSQVLGLLTDSSSSSRSIAISSSSSSENIKESLVDLPSNSIMHIKPSATLTSSPLALKTTNPTAVQSPITLVSAASNPSEKLLPLEVIKLLNELGETLLSSKHYLVSTRPSPSDIEQSTVVKHTLVKISSTMNSAPESTKSSTIDSPTVTNKETSFEALTSNPAFNINSTTFETADTSLLETLTLNHTSNIESTSSKTMISEPAFNLALTTFETAEKSLEALSSKPTTAKETASMKALTLEPASNNTSTKLERAVTSVETSETTSNKESLLSESVVNSMETLSSEPAPNAASTTLAAVVTSPMETLTSEHPPTTEHSSDIASTTSASVVTSMATSTSETISLNSDYDAASSPSVPITSYNPSHVVNSGVANMSDSTSTSQVLNIPFINVYEQANSAPVALVAVNPASATLVENKINDHYQHRSSCNTQQKSDTCDLTLQDTLSNMKSQHGSNLASKELINELKLKLFNQKLQGVSSQIHYKQSESNLVTQEHYNHLKRKIHDETLPEILSKVSKLCEYDDDIQELQELSELCTSRRTRVSSEQRDEIREFSIQHISLNEQEIADIFGIECILVTKIINNERAEMDECSDDIPTLQQCYLPEKQLQYMFEDTLYKKLMHDKACGKITISEDWPKDQLMKEAQHLYKVCGLSLGDFKPTWLWLFNFKFRFKMRITDEDIDFSTRFLPVWHYYGMCLMLHYKL